jgi:acylglycerol lipase
MTVKNNPTTAPINQVRSNHTYLADWLIVDNLERYCHRWIPCRPTSEVRHAFVIVHGLGDHGGRFHSFASELAQSGIAVQAIDLIGHGRSPGKRGRIESFDGLLDEIATSLRMARSVWKTATFTLLGHSMGGNLALSFASQRLSEHDDVPKQILSIDSLPHVDKVIAVAPMLKPFGKEIREDFFNAGVKLAKWLPNWPMRMRSRPEMLTGCPDQQQSYTSDELIHNTMSVQLGIELLQAGRSLMRGQWRSNIHALLIHSDGDQLSDVEGSRAYCKFHRNAELVELTSNEHDPINGVAADEVRGMIAGAVLHKQSAIVRKAA